MPLLAFQWTAHGLIPFPTKISSPDELTRSLPRGLYTTFSTNQNGRCVLGLTAHLDRLYALTESAPRASASRADLRLALAQLAESNAPGESRFRLLRSASDGIMYIIVQPFTPLPKEIYEQGVKVITADLVRHNARLKDSGFIAESRSERRKVGGDIFEVLLAHKGKIYEGMTSNFYVVIAGPKGEAIFASERGLLRRSAPRNGDATLVTARHGILLGVTRRAVLRLARGEGMRIEYRPPRVDENFAEAFLTSSSRGVVPIVQIDDRAVGEGRVGAWTKRLISAYQAYVEERSEELVA